MNQSGGPYQLTTYPWARAHRQVLKQAMSPMLWYGMWLVPIIGGAWIALCLVTPDIALIFGAPTPAIAGGLTVVVFVMMVQRRNAGLNLAFNASAFRAGDWRTTIADDGLHLETVNVRQVFAWHTITEVRDGPDGLLVMLGPTVFLPVPAKAFSDTASMQAFRDALSARLAAGGFANRGVT